MENIEKQVNEKITDMLHCCYDNVSDIEDFEKIYVFLWNEGNNLYVEYDYQIGGEKVDRDKISEYASSMHETTIDELKSTLLSLQEMFHEEEYDLPTAYKILYDHNEGTVDVEFEFESLEPEGKWSGEYYIEWLNNN